MSEYPPTHVVKLEGCRCGDGFGDCGCATEIEVCDACGLEADRDCACEPREVDDNASLGLQDRREAPP